MVRYFNVVHDMCGCFVNDALRLQALYRTHKKGTCRKLQLPIQ